MARHLPAAPRILRWLFLTIVGTYPTACGTYAGDWPQFLGPQRDGSAVDESPLTAIPAAGLNATWRCDVGQGYAGAAVAGSRVYVYHRVADDEIIESRDTDTGNVAWKRAFTTDYVCSYNSDGGPRCVPLVHGSHVILFGAGGQLRCLDSATGATVWEHDTRAEFGAAEGYFGTGSSPVIHNHLVIANVGGKNGVGIGAFRLDNGALQWSIPDEQASYASPKIENVDGEPQLLCITRFHFVTANPMTGKVLAQIPFGARGPTVNAAAPQTFENHVLLSASYGVGARWVHLNRQSARPLWDRQDIMSSQYSTCVEYQGTFFGIDGREDVGSTALRAFDPQAPSVLWEEKDFGMASLLRVNNTILILKTDGQLVLIKATPDKYVELGRTTIDAGPIRALPAYSRGRLYVRGAEQLYCLRMSDT